MGQNKTRLSVAKITIKLTYELKAFKCCQHVQVQLLLFRVCGNINK